MDARELTDKLTTSTPDELADVLQRIDRHTASAAGEVDWWETTLAVDTALRSSGRTREAAAAAQQAARLVRHSPAAQQLGDDAAIRLARAAAELARAIVAGLSLAVLPALAEAWGPVVLPVAA